MCVFALLTFLQGIAEPTEGLVSQQNVSALRSLGRSTAEVTSFSAALSLPWILKPAFGLLLDFLPSIRQRRIAALLLTGGTWSVVFPFLALANRVEPSAPPILSVLLLATAVAALADVATDALVVEWGLITRQTGRFQAAVWFSSYASGIATGLLGGACSQHGWVGPAYLACGLMGLGVVGLTALGVREPSTLQARPGWNDLRRTLGGCIRNRGIWTVAIFLWLCNFNPLTNRILQLHLKTTQNVSEQFFGITLTVFALAAMAAAAAYGVYSSRFSIVVLAYGSVVLGAVANLAYSPIAGEGSVLAASVVVGICYMTATLVQLDLAARVCPPGATATVFATLLALSNLSIVLSTWLGGYVYEAIELSSGSGAAFQGLILLGAATTGLAALVIPFFPREVLGSINPNERAQPAKE
jgi:hypothetical protein